MTFRSTIARPVRQILRRAGTDLASTNRYGCDAFLDIERLAQTWQQSIDLFFDVGANAGQTVRLARKRFKNSHIVAFEPHPDTFVKLKEQMKHAQNVELVNLALGSEAGTKTMYEYEGHDVLSSLVPNAQFSVRFGGSPKEIAIECTTVDRFCLEHQFSTIDVLKIDTEGYDLDVLRGARSMLEKQAVKFIYCEFNDIHPRSDAFGGALAPIDEWVRPHGYRFIASYNDYLVDDGELFFVSNALYALQPR